MAGCGYVCPVCEGRGRDDSGNDCEWCQVTSSIVNKTPKSAGGDAEKPEEELLFPGPLKDSET